MISRGNVANNRIRHIYVMLLIVLCLTTVQPAYGQRPAAPPKPTDAVDVTKWLTANAIRLKSVQAGSGFEDLQPLKRVLKDVKVVGLGEATHGTREFFQFKHRMLEFLVKEMGFNIFALEASYARVLKVNEYVLGGEVNRPTVLSSLGFALWMTEEVAALVDWVREYNNTAPPERKVKFLGFDLQESWSTKEVIKAYLQRVDPEKLQAIAPAFTNFDKAIQAAFGGSKDGLTALLPEMDKLINYFVLREAVFVKKSSAAEYQNALHHLRLLAQFADMAGKGFSDARDRYMAENLLYILNREGAGARAVVWAHNAHVSTGEINSFPGGGYPMGAYLRQVIGKEYYAFGFTFNEGSFQAMINPPKDGSAFAEYTTGPGPENSLDWYFARPKIGNYLIDFRHSPQDATIQQWLATPRGLRWVGGYGVPEDIGARWASGSMLPSTLSKEYDGMIFIEKTTRARPLPKEAFQ